MLDELSRSSSPLRLCFTHFDTLVITLSLNNYDLTDSEK